MKFSTRTTYGLRAMINLAKNKKEKSVSLAKIAQDEAISLKYLEKLFTALKFNNLVKAEIGAGGGYKLVRKPSEITIYDIVIALEGESKLFHCLNGKQKISCASDCHCGANRIMAKLQAVIDKTLLNTKLSQLL